MTEVLAGLIGVFLLVVVVWSGLKGTEAPDRNFSVTFVFVTVWLGLVVLSVVFGDVFRAFNPWRAIARASAACSSWSPDSRRRRRSPIPSASGAGRRSPACSPSSGSSSSTAPSGFQTVGLTPHTVAIATLAYTAYTFVGMALFGSERWLERGEAFSVYFGMFASLAPLEVRDGRLGLRRALSAATSWVAVPGSVALVLVTIGATTFDGASEGALAEPIATVIDWLVDLGLGPVAALRIANTLFLALTLGFVAGLFWAGIYGMHTVRTSVSHRAARARCSRTPSSRSRSPTSSPTTSASSSSRSRRSSASCSPTRSATAPTSSAPPAAASTTG